MFMSRLTARNTNSVKASVLDKEYERDASSIRKVSAAHSAVSVHEPIKALLQPRSIAIVGASSDPRKLGSMPLTFLLKHGYRGKIYPIHPSLEQISGISCFKSIAEIDDHVDLLVVAVAAARINSLLEECRPGQVKAAVILSSGFAESGVEGEQLQAVLRSHALTKGIRFIGPNSVGIANLRDQVVACISQAFDEPGLASGAVGFVSQSGAVGTAITALAHAEQIGLSCFVSTGNEADLEFGDFCDYFASDPSIRIIAGYLESVRDGSKFRAAAAKAASAGKPVILIKVGTTDVGSRAVRSHTGALAGSEEVYRTAFEQSGVIRAHSIEELIDLLKVFSAFPQARITPGTRGRVAILSHSGGAGVLMGDTCFNEGLDIAAPSDRLTRALQTQLPSYAALQNPIDMTANVVFDPVLMVGTMREVVESGEYDASLLCVNLIWRQGKQLAEQLKAMAAGPDRLIAVTWIAGKREHIDELNRSGIPVFSDPVRCARAVAERLRWEGAPRAAMLIADPSRSIDAGAASRDLRGFQAQEQLLRAYGIPLASAVLTEDYEHARRAAAELGYPVAAKLIARNLTHKSEIGGVHLAIGSDQDLRERFAILNDISIPGKEGILIQKMTGGVLEIFVGMTRDPAFGPVIVVGLGGIYVEIIKETVMRLSPIDTTAAHQLLRSAKFFPLMDGARGRRKLDITGLSEIISRVSELGCAEPSILTLDLNPIMLNEHGAQVVDFKIECVQ